MHQLQGLDQTLQPPLASVVKTGANEGLLVMDPHDEFSGVWDANAKHWDLTRPCRLSPVQL